MGTELGAILNEYGVVGLLGVMVAQFVITQMLNSRARTALEVRTAERLNEKNDEIVALMDKQVSERDAKINTLMVAQEQALKQNKKTLEELTGAKGRIDVLEVGEREAATLIEELKMRLDHTKKELEHYRVESEKIPPLLNELVELRTRLNAIEAELKLEKQLRDVAEKRVKNLEYANKKATSANKALTERVNALSTQNQQQSERIVVLEKSLIEMAHKPEVGHAEENQRDGDLGGDVVFAGDADASAGAGDGAGGAGGGDSAGDVGESSAGDGGAG